MKKHCCWRWNDGGFNEAADEIYRQRYTYWWQLKDGRVFHVEISWPGSCTKSGGGGWTNLKQKSTWSIPKILSMPTRLHSRPTWLSPRSYTTSSSCSLSRSDCSSSSSTATSRYECGCLTSRSLGWHGLFQHGSQKQWKESIFVASRWSRWLSNWSAPKLDLLVFTQVKC